MWIRDEKSRIRDKQHGSATLVNSLPVRILVSTDSRRSRTHFPNIANADPGWIPAVLPIRNNLSGIRDRIRPFLFFNFKICTVDGIILNVTAV